MKLVTNEVCAWIRPSSEFFFNCFYMYDEYLDNPHLQRTNFCNVGSPALTHIT